MESKEYIINELETFIKKFPNVRVRYEYDENALVHIVEVLPNEVYSLDEEYILWERQMFHEFIGLYSDENICFISDDACVGIENAEFTLCGAGYMVFVVRENVVFNQPVNGNIVFNDTFSLKTEEKYPNETMQVQFEYTSEEYLLAA